MYAIVTGASSGIGLEYAKQLASSYHYDLLLISNQPEELEKVAEDIRLRDKVTVLTMMMDLAAPDAAEQVHDFALQHHLDVNVLVNNAGILLFGMLVDAPMRRIDTLLGLHVVTTTKLCRLFGEDMAEKGRGYILNMSSMTAWTAMPTIQAYNATKAYLLNFSKSLWYELHPHGVHVLAVTPGSTNTGLLPFPAQFAHLLKALGVTQEPATLVKRALRHLFRSQKKVYLPGAWNLITVPLIKHLPDWLVAVALKKLGFVN